MLYREDRHIVATEIRTPTNCTKFSTAVSNMVHATELCLGGRVFRVDCDRISRGKRQLLSMLRSRPLQVGVCV